MSLPLKPPEAGKSVLSTRTSLFLLNLKVCYLLTVIGSEEGGPSGIAVR